MVLLTSQEPLNKSEISLIALFSFKKLVLKTFKKRQTKQTLLNFSWSEYNLTLFPPRHKTKTATQEPGHWLKACIWRKGPTCMKGVWRPFKGAGQVRTGHQVKRDDWSIQDKSSQNMSIQVRLKWVRTCQVRSGKVKLRQVKSGQMRTGQKCRSGPRQEI